MDLSKDSSPDTLTRYLYAITVYDTSFKPQKMVAASYNLDMVNFIYKKPMRDGLNLGIGFIVERSQTKLDDVCRCFHDDDKKFKIYVAKVGNLCIGCATDNAYDKFVAIDLVNKITGELSPCSEESSQAQKIIEQYIKKYRISDDMNKIIQVQKSLDEIKETMSQNIDMILKQGETIESLVEKSENLSESSKRLLSGVEKLNRCPGCVIL